MYSTRGARRWRAGARSRQASHGQRSTATEQPSPPSLCGASSIRTTIGSDPRSSLTRFLRAPVPWPWITHREPLASARSRAAASLLPCKMSGRQAADVAVRVRHGHQLASCVVILEYELPTRVIPLRVHAVHQPHRMALPLDDFGVVRMMVIFDFCALFSHLTAHARARRMRRPSRALRAPASASTPEPPALRRR